jgi:hypothetical protein
MLWDSDASGAAISQEYSVVYAPLTIESLKDDALDSQINPATPNAFDLPDDEEYGHVSGFDASVDVEFARVGDVMQFGGVNYTVDVIDGTRLEVSPLIPMDATSGAFTLHSVEGESYGVGNSFPELQTNLESWLETYNSTADLKEINRHLAKVRANPSHSSRVALLADLISLRDLFTGVSSLEEHLEAYTCRPVGEIGAILTALEESGYDKAREELLSLDISGFLTDGNPVSYSEAVQRKLLSILAQYRKREAYGDPDEFIWEDVDEQIEYVEPVEETILMPEEVDAE